MPKKVKLWFDAEGDYLEVTFSDAPDHPRETKSNAVMQRVNEQGRVIGFSALGVSKFQVRSKRNSLQERRSGTARAARHQH